MGIVERPTFTPAERTRLVAILARLSSTFDGERAAAGLLATRMLGTLGLSWDSLIATQLQSETRQDDTPHPNAQGWRADLALCRRERMALSDWEAGFITSISGRRSLTVHQAAKLQQIADGVRSKAKP